MITDVKGKEINEICKIKYIGGNFSKSLLIPIGTIGQVTGNKVFWENEIIGKINREKQTPFTLIEVIE